MGGDRLPGLRLGSVRSHPDEDNKPNDQSTKPKANPKPQVLQPPPPAQQPADLPPAIAENRDQDEEQAADLSWLGPVLLYGGLTLGILLLLAAPFIVMGVIKGVRRARRRNAERTADRISGGWDELVDSAVDLRAPVAIGATRAESALVVGSTFDDPRVTQLAHRADVDVFGPGDPAPRMSTPSGAKSMTSSARCADRRPSGSAFAHG